jgi:cyclophilin family peptidyl-prolyl cis-trans isomerase
MARTNDPNSASCQFFICVADAGFLDKQYTVFGQVTDGMDVVDKIVNLPDVTGKPQGTNPGRAAEVYKMYVEND